MIAGDIREQIFASLASRRFKATVTTCQAGVISGVAAAAEEADRHGLVVEGAASEGAALDPGGEVLTLSGPAIAIARGEERLMGLMCKPSGIATAARQAVELAKAAGGVRVVSGAWKKMPPEWKGPVRQAVQSGGLASRILDEPFIYLDKNYVRMLGGIQPTLDAVQGLAGTKVIQVRGYEADIATETSLACRSGAGVIMVDTGRREDLTAAVHVARKFPGVQVAFAGGIRLLDIPALAELGAHILDIGAAILDAPLLDLRFDVTLA